MAWPVFLAMCSGKPYFTNAGRKRDPILWRDRYAALSARESRDVHTPTGMALGTGWDDEGRSLYRLIAHGAEVPGRWIVVGREFWPRVDAGQRRLPRSKTLHGRGRSRR